MAKQQDSSIVLSASEDVDAVQSDVSLAPDHPSQLGVSTQVANVPADNHESRTGKTLSDGKILEVILDELFSRSSAGH